MSTFAEAQLRYVAIKTVVDALVAELAALKAEHTETVLAQYAATGSRSADARLPDGTTVATVTVPMSAAATKVTNPAALLEWAAGARPELIAHTEVPAVPAHTVAALREAAEAVIASTAVLGEGGSLVDPETGEVIPGIVHVHAAPTGHIRVSYPKGGRGQAAVWAAYLAGELDGVLAGLSLPALGPGPS